MGARKTAISVPEELLDQVDRAARERGESRSRFINRVLRAAVRARHDAEVTRRLDEIFAAGDLRTELADSAEELDAEGSDWSDEAP